MSTEAVIIVCSIFLIAIVLLAEPPEYASAPARNGAFAGAPAGAFAGAPVRTGGTRERYGPPPGMRRALDHYELEDDRGWPGFDKVYEASSASAISHMIERSA